MYLDTHSGPVMVTLTGREEVTRMGVRAIEVAGWLKEPIFVTAERLSESPDFSQNTIQRMRERN